MKRFLLLFSILISCVFVKAQELAVEDFLPLPEDNEAFESEVYDNNDNLCALIKVFAPDLPGLGFSSSYIIQEDDSDFDKGYYKVFVSNGIRSMDIKHSDYLPAKVNFRDDYGIRLEPGKVYRMNIAAKGQKIKPTQTVIFDINPESGNIAVGENNYKFENGGTQIEFAPGRYHYIISSENYHPAEGDFSVTDISTAQNIGVSLQPIMCDVDIVILNNVKDPELIVDNKKIGSPGKVKIQQGKRNIRVRAENYLEYKKKDEDIYQGKKIEIKLTPKSVVPAVITCDKSFKNPKLYINQKEVIGWKNDGKTIMVNKGKQHVMVVEQIETKGASSGVTTYKDGRSVSKFVRFTPDMSPVNLSK